MARRLMSRPIPGRCYCRSSRQRTPFPTRPAPSKVRAKAILSAASPPDTQVSIHGPASCRPIGAPVTRRFGRRERRGGSWAKRGSSVAAAGPLAQAMQEGVAGVDLFQFDEFIGLMSLIDRAGPANDSGNTGLLKDAAFGGKGYRCAFVRTGEAPDQALGGAFLLLRQRRDDRERLGFDRGVRCEFP